MKSAFCFAIFAFFLLQGTGARCETLAELKAGLNLHQDLIPPGKFGRIPNRTFSSERFLTIHSTEVTQGFADARHFARRLRTGEETSTDRRSRTGYKTWHFTVDSSSVIQHLPTNEQGDHADFSGPGNRSSIGIEMCENIGADFSSTKDRATRLIAYLCVSEHIPEKNLRMHWHWGQQPLDPKKPPYHKQCPHSFLDVIANDKFVPNRNWENFRSKVHLYIEALQGQ
jgi:N-acetylmuramoyl-L-alanine amidase